MDTIDHPEPRRMTATRSIRVRVTRAEFVSRLVREAEERRALRFHAPARAERQQQRPAGSGSDPAPGENFKKNRG